MLVAVAAAVLFFFFQSEIRSTITEQLTAHINSREERVADLLNRYSDTSRHTSQEALQAVESDVDRVSPYGAVFPFVRARSLSLEAYSFYSHDSSLVATSTLNPSCSSFNFKAFASGFSSSATRIDIFLFGISLCLVMFGYRYG